MKLKIQESRKSTHRISVLGTLMAVMFLASACQETASKAVNLERPENPSSIQQGSLEASLAKQQSGTIFLVRHAEKKTEKQDPDLSDAGVKRAAELAVMLNDAQITHIHSSDYKRTRNTAAPLAKALGLNVELYDPRDLPAMAEKLKLAGGRHLVVGHSNTTPQLTELLGGEGGAPIVEATEYDRLYVVALGQDGSVSSTLLRFGE